MSLTLFIHLMAIGIWIGCILVEAVIETVGARSDTEMQTAITQHYYTDIFVEIPCYVVILTSGFMLIDFDNIGTALSIKIACALLAISLNIACTIVVFKRQFLLTEGRFAETPKYTKAIGIMGALFFPLFLIALAYGISFIL